MRASNLHEIVIVCGIGISNACFLCICEISRRYFIPIQKKNRLSRSMDKFASLQIKP